MRSQVEGAVQAMTYKFFRGIFRLIFRLFFKVEVIGRDQIPFETGGIIFCSNHISNWDPFFVGSQVEPMLRYMAKEELFKIPLFGKLLPKLGAYPVKRGAVSKETIVNSIRIIRGGGHIVIFPEGTRGGGSAKRGAAILALKSKAIVVPVAIISSYKLFAPLRVVYGAPLDLTTFNTENSDEGQRAADAIMSSIEQLKQNYLLQSAL